MEESDEAEGGSQATQGRLLVGVELGHGAGRLPPAALGQPLGPRIAHRPTRAQAPLQLTPQWS